MTNTWYNITQAEGDASSAEISIYDSIGGYEINAKQFVEELGEIKADTIHLRINSPGGSVIDGIAISNALLRHDAKVITHIDGLAASMASVVAMVGHEVHMADNALMMIHNPWTVTMGDADELRADADLLDKMSESIMNAYSRSQYEKEQIKDMMDKETWLTAQEAFDTGFIDHIESGLRAAASDITALAELSELKVPADKQIASLNKQLEAVTKTSAEISEQLAEIKGENETLTGELAQAIIDRDEANELVSEAADRIEVLDLEIIEKDEEIKTSKEVSEAAVASKAAEIVQLASHEPVADNGDGLGAETDEQLLARYESISDKDDRRDFFAANKTKILRAKARN